MYVESDNLLEMLEEGMGESGSLIEAPNSSTEYYGPEEGWLGDLQEEGVIYNEEMYYVLTTADVTVTLTGAPADPSAHPITILPNEWNRIGFPYSEAVAVNDALAGFPAVDGDMIESPDGSLYYVEGEGWMGDFEEFTPGVGYMFQSFSDEERTLVFSTGAPSAKTRRTSPVSGRIPGERMRPTNKNGK